MNRNAILVLALALVFSSMGSVLAASICDNAPCEQTINASLGKEFTISFESNPMSTGFEWWTKFDPEYLSLVSESFVKGNASERMVGVPGTQVFTFAPKKAGETNAIMLSLQPWENGTIGTRKIFPIVIT